MTAPSTLKTFLTQSVMFRKNKSSSIPPSGKKDGIPSILTREMHMLGNIISDGAIDFSGTLDGNIRCKSIIIRPEGTIKGEVTADDVAVHGKVKGLIRAKNVHFYPSCNVEGIIMHEGLTIEDGAFVDGKFKRTDRPQTAAVPDFSAESEKERFSFDEEEREESNVKIMDNIRLIR